MENKVFEYLKSKNMSISSFSDMLKYNRRQVSAVIRKRAAGSRRLIRAIIAATEGACEESDFLLSEKKAGK